MMKILRALALGACLWFGSYAFAWWLFTALPDSSLFRTASLFGLARIPLATALAIALFPLFFRRRGSYRPRTTAALAVLAVLLGFVARYVPAVARLKNGEPSFACTPPRDWPQGYGCFQRLSFGSGYYRGAGRPQPPSCASFARWEGKLARHDTPRDLDYLVNKDEIDVPEIHAAIGRENERLGCTPHDPRRWSRVDCAGYSLSGGAQCFTCEEWKGSYSVVGQYINWTSLDHLQAFSADCSQGLLYKSVGIGADQIHYFADF